MKAGSCGRQRLSRSASLAWPILFLAAGCAPEAPTRPEVTRPVKTMVVAAGGETNTRSFPGKAEASKEVDLAFQVSGLLVNIPVKEGQNLVRGEVIAQLRPDEFQARLTALQGQLDQARAVLSALRAGERVEQRLRLEAQVRAAEARLANARAEYQRFAELLPTNAVARVDYDRAEAGFRVAQEDYTAALQMLEKGTIAREEDILAQEAVVRGLEGRTLEASIQLADCTLRAPFDGVIAQRFVEQNQNISAKSPVVKFQDVGEIVVAVDVPESVMAAGIRSDDIEQMLAEFSAAPGRQFPVQLTEVAQRADPTTQTFRVRASLDTPPGVNLLPGMTATITMRYRGAGEAVGRIFVPIAAVYQDSSGQQVVWVLGPTEVVAPRPVTLGDAAGGRVEIVQGLQPGDRIAVAGVTFLRDGMKVRDLGDALGGGAS